MSHLFLLGITLVSAGYQSRAADRSLVEDPAASNMALMVGVSHGLPGIDIDVENMDAIIHHPAFQYQDQKLEEEKGTIKNVEGRLSKTATLAGSKGSLFFYFSGHGSANNIYLQDGLLSVSRMRTAIEQGRKSLGPLLRLTLMFDSCYSGSLLGPFRSVLKLAELEPETTAETFASNVVSVFGSRSSYWRKLFVFASSRADETSLAGEEGSVFTVALKKAYDEVIIQNGTMGEWISKTKTYTQGHHPVDRLVPASLQGEFVVPNPN